LLSVPVQVIAWRTVSEKTCNVLNLTHSLTHFSGELSIQVVCLFSEYQKHPILRYTPFTRWSWLDELALRAGYTSARRAASWTFAILHHSNEQIASSSSQLDERSSSQLHRLNGVLRLLPHASVPQSIFLQ